MKTYTSIENTPLKFHNIYSTLVLPMDSFLNIYSLITLVSALYSGGFDGIWDYISLIMTVVYLVLIFMGFRGLMYFRRSAFYAVSALLSLQILDNSYTLYLSAKNGDVIFSFSSLLSILILLLMMGYYIRRRRLFSPQGISYEKLLSLRGRRVAAARVEEEEKIVEEEILMEEEEKVGEYDCPRCGFHITDGKVFCPKCGAQTRKVR